MAALIYFTQNQSNIPMKKTINIREKISESYSRIFSNENEIKTIYHLYYKNLTTQLPIQMLKMR